VRFTFEVLQAMCSVDGGDRVGLRICPGIPFNDVKDPNPLESTEALLKVIEPLGLAYLHVIRASTIDIISVANRLFAGQIVVNGSYDRESAEQVIKEGHATVVAFGSPYIANPDFARRLQERLPLNEIDIDKMYTPTEEGYLDYAMYAE
jgi:N-ethylmaleimide reductase